MSGRQTVAETLIDYLRSQGLLPPPKVTALTGGVSGETFLVETAPSRLVVKRALGRLLVAGEWTAKPERAMTEASALELLHSITPEHTPALCHADPSRHTLVMTAAPADWPTWKSVILASAPSELTARIPETAGELGTVLGTWHSRTWHDADIAARFNDYEALEQLRVTPFHRRVAVQHPGVAARITACAQELVTRRDCLVHGDFSPKNVLVGPNGPMVLDFEVAHFGAAVLDLAFLQCHLILKALHIPERKDQLADAAQRFLASYERECPEPVEKLGAHTACLLLARVDGLSPAGYLDTATRDAVRRLALGLLADDDPSISEVWNRTLEAAR
ncbi:phosphotransferase family protein [Streptomyces tubercidicus]|uniref:phosphotransferase family protein n=1 Tax=Streptomyces tubercidicus TaxID=47759 RepID=UPI00367EF6C9